MPSLFRIDKNSITADVNKPASVIVLPGFEDIVGKKINGEDDETPEPQAPVETREDILQREKRKQLAELEKQIIEAQERAKAIISQANTDAVKLSEDATRKGYDEGYAEAVAAAREQLNKRERELEDATVGLIKAKDDIFAQVEDSVLDLSLYIAERIVKTELARNDEVFLNILRDTLTKVKYQSNIVVKVSKNEFEHIFANNPGDIQTELKNSGVEVKQDLSLGSGECIVETEYGNINAGVNIQLECIRAALKEDAAE